MKNRPLFDVMKFLFLELASSLHERKRDEEFAVVDKLFKDALSYQDELVLFQELKNAIDYLTLEKNLTVTFLLERFETYIPRATEAFFNNLRSIRNRAKYKFSVVFSTTRPLEDVLEPELLADFYEYVADNHVYLSLFDKVGLAFRVSYLEKLTHEKIAQTTVDTLIALTGGHGKLMRLALESAFSHNKTIDATSLLQLKTIQGALLEIWYFLTPDEQQDVLAICKNTSQITNDFLQNIGLIKSSSITIPLFKDFCLAQREKGKQPAVFTLDLITNTIQRGDTVISDMLTRSEFRLFKLLLESQGAILSREDIIQAVWTDSKTQEGVSEQALDQLVFRLRKKVEEDPNNPMLIQTVKGRGFRFVQPLS